MMLALKAANSKNIPCVFDPVGSGATSYRTRVANSILNHGAITAITRSRNYLTIIGFKIMFRAYETFRCSIITASHSAKASA
jgi:hypothetical protein